MADSEWWNPLTWWNSSDSSGSNDDGQGMPGAFDVPGAPEEPGAPSCFFSDPTAFVWDTMYDDMGHMLGFGAGPGQVQPGFAQPSDPEFGPIQLPQSEDPSSAPSVGNSGEAPAPGSDAPNSPNTDSPPADPYSLPTQRQIDAWHAEHYPYPSPFNPGETTDLQTDGPSIRSDPEFSPGSSLRLGGSPADVKPKSREPKDDWEDFKDLSKEKAKDEAEKKGYEELLEQMIKHDVGGTELLEFFGYNPVGLAISAGLFLYDLIETPEDLALKHFDEYPPIERYRPPGQGAVPSERAPQ
jgi:hypothetical protein